MKLMGFLGLLLLVAESRAQEGVTLDMSTLYKTNIGNADRRQDRLEDTVLSSGATYAYSQLITDRSAVALHTSAHYQHHTRFDDLSHLDFGLGAKYRLQPVLGFGKPWFEVDGKVNNLQHQDSEMRDGSIYRIDLMVGQQLTDKIRLLVGTGWETRHAQTKVFDTSQHNLFAKLDYRWDGRNLFYLNGLLAHGDQVSTAAIPVSPILRAEAKVIEADPALSGSNARNAYRVDAKAHVLELGYNHAVTEVTAVDFSLKGFDVDAEAGLRYSGVILQASLLYRL